MNTIRLPGVSGPRADEIRADIMQMTAGDVTFDNLPGGDILVSSPHAKNVAVARMAWDY